jgi:hypothetical protein
MDKQTCKIELVDALVQCPTLAEKAGRNLCVDLLKPPIASQATRHDDRSDDLLSIVSTCLNYEGGIDSLVTAVEGREKNSRYMPRVRECAEALKAVLQREERERAGDRIGPTEPSGATMGAQIEPGYALSIGISTYVQLDEKEDRAPTNRFRDLSFAADDARAFHELLKTQGYRGPEPLLNEQATLRGIMHAMDTLRRQCKESTNPLVLIFFSGHGARDSDDRHYLVPHDGVPDALFGTALWSRTFENALRLINTNRLVVFLDTCHAAGIENDRNKGPRTCDPRILLEEQLKEQRGRYLIASCLANQAAQERDDGHGIFSHELLELMKCEKEGDSEGEVVDLRGLFVELRKRVLDKANQEPWSNVQQRTPDIILAINRARRDARIFREKALLEAVHEELRRRQHQESELIHIALLKFITGRFVENPRGYFLYFRQSASKMIGVPPSPELVEGFCEALNYYPELGGALSDRARDAISKPRPVSARPEPTGPQAARAPAEPSRSPAQPARDASERLPAKHPSTSVGQPTSARLSDRRWLPLNDIESLLAMVRQHGGNLGHVGKIKALLINGTSEREFRTYLERTCRDADESWVALVNKLGAEFDSCWPRAYKPGVWACPPEDIDLLRIAERLRQQPHRPIDDLVARKLSIENEEAIAEYRGEPDQLLAEVFAHCLNTLIHKEPIWEQGVDGIELRPETASLHSQNPQGENLQRLNRMLLEDAYPGGLQRRVEDQLILRRGRASGDQGGSDA